MNNSWCRKHEAILNILYALFLGQLVSFVLAIVSFCSSINASLGADTPLTLSFFTYLSLTLVYGGILLYRRQKLLVPWYWYVLLGFVDVQGNYLVNKSFQYTSVTSVALLDCFVIAWVMILTWLVLSTHYSHWQFVGAAICILGLGLVFLSDAEADGGGGSNPILGDILVIGGTFFIAFSNTSEVEFCVKKKDRVEVVAMIGLFGMLVRSMLEKKNLESVKWSTEIILGFAGFAGASFLFYTLIPIVLKLVFCIKRLRGRKFVKWFDRPSARVSGSTMFYLSLLTSDMWAVVMRIFFYHQKVDWLYYVSFAIVVIGLVIYSKTEKDPAPLPALDDGNHSPGYQVLDGESSDSRVAPMVA